MATYVALTTSNYQLNGYHEVARGNNKKRVRNDALASLGDVKTGYGTDIYTDTERKNLIVVSITEAKRNRWIKDEY